MYVRGAAQKSETLNIARTDNRVYVFLQSMSSDSAFNFALSQRLLQQVFDDQAPRQDNSNGLIALKRVANLLKRTNGRVDHRP